MIPGHDCQSLGTWITKEGLPSHVWQSQPGLRLSQPIKEVAFRLLYIQRIPQLQRQLHGAHPFNVNPSRRALLGRTPKPAYAKPTSTRIVGAA